MKSTDVSSVVHCIPDQLVMFFCLSINPGGSLPDHFLDGKDLRIPNDRCISYIPWGIPNDPRALILNHLHLNVCFCCVAPGCSSIQHRRNNHSSVYNLLFLRLRMLRRSTSGLNRKAIPPSMLVAYVLWARYVSFLYKISSKYFICCPHSIAASLK